MDKIYELNAKAVKALNDKDIDLFLELLDAGAGSDSEHTLSHLCLRCVSVRDDLYIIEKLLSLSKKQDYDMLSMITYVKSIDAVEYLFNKIPQEKRTDVISVTFQRAGFDGNIELVTYLLNSKRAYITDKVLDYLIYCNIVLQKYPNIMKLIIETTSYKIRPVYILHAINYNRLTIFKYLIDNSDIDLNVISSDIYWENVNIELIKYIIENRGVDAIPIKRKTTIIIQLLNEGFDYKKLKHYADIFVEKRRILQKKYIDYIDTSTKNNHTQVPTDVMWIIMDYAVEYQM